MADADAVGMLVAEISARVAESGVPAILLLALVADVDVTIVVGDCEELETTLFCCCCFEEAAVFAAEDTACDVGVDLTWAEVEGDGVFAAAEVAFEGDAWEVLLSALTVFVLTADCAGEDLPVMVTYPATGPVNDADMVT